MTNPKEALEWYENYPSGHSQTGGDLINRTDAIKIVHKYFIDALNKEPHEIDEDGYDVFTNMKSVNALLHHNKMVSKALKALPSAEAEEHRIYKDGYNTGKAHASAKVVQGEWLYRWNDVECSVCGEFAKDKSNFCPNCGTKMKGADDETD